MKKRVRIIMLVMTAFVIFGCIMTASSATVAPRWVIKNMMRADDTPGLRFSAKIYGDQRDDEKLEEYGFIIAAWDELQEKDVSVSAFTHNSPVSYLCSVNYSKSDGEIKIDKVFDVSDGGQVTYTCVIANIPEQHYESGIVAKPYIKYDGEIIYGVSFRVNYLAAAQNMLKSEEFEALSDEEKARVESVANYGIEEEDGIVNTPSAEPEEPVVPEEPETVEECNYRIIKSSEPCIDEDNYYRNYYTVLNLMTGKTETVYGNLTSATSSGIENTAVQIGSVVILKDGFVDDISGTVIDTFNAVQSPRHEIEDGKYKAGLVWITKCDTTDKVIEAYNVADGANWYDIGETVTFRFDSNIAVTMLKNAKANDLVQWGTFILLTIEDLASSKNDYRCYNTKVLGDNNNLKTGYAKYIKAYIVTENRQDLEEGEHNKVLSATVIVNGSENKAHLVTNKKPSAETE